ncbi:hypothetical protein LTR17_006130 [Elasticomyces elasticus]|nr:hypothetical protein LTR17_006130 [Elasticomyces elasticus]
MAMVPPHVDGAWLVVFVAGINGGYMSDSKRPSKFKDLPLLREEHIWEPDPYNLRDIIDTGGHQATDCYYTPSPPSSPLHEPGTSLSFEPCRLIRIGSDASQCHLVFPSQHAVSAHHFDIVRTPHGTCTVVVYAKNGIYIDDTKIERATSYAVPLRKVLHIGAGRTRLQLYMTAEFAKDNHPLSLHSPTSPEAFDSALTSILDRPQQANTLSSQILTQNMAQLTISTIAKGPSIYHVCDAWKIGATTIISDKGSNLCSTVVPAVHTRTGYFGLAKGYACPNAAFQIEIGRLLLLHWLERSRLLSDSRPNVVRPLAYDSRTQRLVLEYGGVHSLASWPLHIDCLYGPLIQLVPALQRCHTNGVCHRSISGHSVTYIPHAVKQPLYMYYLGGFEEFDILDSWSGSGGSPRTDTEKDKRKDFGDLACALFMSLGDRRDGSPEHLRDSFLALALAGEVSPAELGQVLEVEDPEQQIDPVLWRILITLLGLREEKGGHNLADSIRCLIRLMEKLPQQTTDSIAIQHTENLTLEPGKEFSVAALTCFYRKYIRCTRSDASVCMELWDYLISRPSRQGLMPWRSVRNLFARLDKHSSPLKWLEEPADTATFVACTFDTWVLIIPEFGLVNMSHFLRTVERSDWVRYSNVLGNAFEVYGSHRVRGLYVNGTLDAKIGTLRLDIASTERRFELEDSQDMIHILTDLLWCPMVIMRRSDAATKWSAYITDPALIGFPDDWLPFQTSCQFCDDHQLGAMKQYICELEARERTRPLNWDVYETDPFDSDSNGAQNRDGASVTSVATEFDPLRFKRTRHT